MIINATIAISMAMPRINILCGVFLREILPRRILS